MTASLLFNQFNRAKQWLTTWPDRMPSKCPLCAMTSAGGHLCMGCEADFFWGRQRRPICGRCGSELQPHPPSAPCTNCSSEWSVDAMACALDYSFGGQLLVARYKERGQLSLARPLARLMVRAAQPLLRAYQPMAWVPMAASGRRLNRSGFSPAQQLATLVAKQTAMPCRLEYLLQTDPVVPQKALGRDERRQAVRGRFLATGLPIGCVVGLIDDVVTTGYTIDAAAKALKQAGAAKVVAVVAARTPKRS